VLPGVTNSVTLDRVGVSWSSVAMALPRMLMAVLISVLAAACGSEDHGDATTPPAAPGNLSASVVAGGAHLTWSDNSDNEEHFMVMRKPQTGGDFDEVATTTFDTVQYHDESVTAGTVYVYKVVAMNAAGEASSAEVTFTAP
jgi:hypothetical protein